MNRGSWRVIIARTQGAVKDRTCGCVVHIILYKMLSKALAVPPVYSVHGSSTLSSLKSRHGLLHCIGALHDDEGVVLLRVDEDLVLRRVEAHRLELVRVVKLLDKGSALLDERLEEARVGDGDALLDDRACADGNARVVVHDDHLHALVRCDPLHRLFNCGATESGRETCVSVGDGSA